MCTKHFPKPLCEETSNEQNSFAKLRRRNRYPHIVRNRDGSIKHTITDAMVVPYNPYLSKKYNAHINVEIVNSISAVAYLYKYVYKGPDRASIAIVNNAPAQGHDEIKTFLDSRFIGPPEAVWRIFSYPLSGKFPFVQRLSIHLPNAQQVVYVPGDGEAAIANANGKKTQLLAYFERNRIESINPLPENDRGIDEGTGIAFPHAFQLLYKDFPQFYVWHKDGRWDRRKRPKKSDSIGRLPKIHPKQEETFYLALLLNNVTGAKSFDDLKVVEMNGQNHRHLTFKGACSARGLLAEDNEWKVCLREATIMGSTPKQLRQLFVYILINNQPISPLDLWNMNIDNLDAINGAPAAGNHRLFEAMSDDFRYARQQQNAVVDEMDISRCLYYIEDELLSVGMRLTDTNLPEPPLARQIVQNNDNPYIVEQMNYNQVNEINRAAANAEVMNVEQLNTYRAITTAIDNPNDNNRIHFIDAPGGTGKTFLLNAILSHARGTGLIALATASSGIAALLLTGGKTSHSMYGIPLQCTASSNSSHPSRGHAREMLQRASILLWDEAPMSSKIVFNFVDRFLQDLMHSELPFGGKMVILAGDFRQTLAVAKRQGREGIVANLVNRCQWWNNGLTTHRLIRNERIRRLQNYNGNVEEFERFLMDIGNGNDNLFVPQRGNSIKIPDQFVYTESDSLIDFLLWSYPNLNTPNGPLNAADTAILTTTNKGVDEINDVALNIMTDNQPTIALNSVDSVFREANVEEVYYPEEYLNTLTIPGNPPHVLRLKIGAPIVLLRNVDPKHGLCNGTRLTVTSITPRLLGVRIVNGPNAGEITFLPRFDLIITDNKFPFKLKRRQFPVKLAFALTINKAQGQSLNKVAIYLSEPVFSHGQLYVALSRSGNPDNTKVLMKQKDGYQGRFDGLEGFYTQNIVYPEVLRQQQL